MSSPRRIPWPKFIVWWTAVTLLISYVGAQLEETEAAVDILQLATVRSTYYGEKYAPTTRVLRGTGSNMDNDVMNNEERGYLLKGVKKFVHKPAITATLAISLLIRDSPAKVLTRFRQRGISMKEDNLLPWLGYVQKYRSKFGYTSADDAYVIKTLKDVAPDIQLPALFKAMEKKDNLSLFAKELKLASKTS
ncbi:RxLR effector protein [Phytophthora megakarya]|uniref:RxLR effector protein n=1 Tax=Phytophthora megakarya TaxID=4795 RepID=A0A225VIQ2_9STRA|nr:RxLR effector protein [Phytophthora megakarya]